MGTHPLADTVYQAIRTEADAALRPIGLLLPQLAALAMLTQTPGASNADLARAAFVSPQSMGEVLDAMATSGLIRRTPDSRNGLVLRTTLTRTGKQMLKSADAALSRVENPLVAALTADEERLMRQLLARCADALRTYRATATTTNLGSRLKVQGNRMAGALAGLANITAGRT